MAIGVVLVVFLATAGLIAGGVIGRAPGTSDGASVSPLASSTASSTGSPGSPVSTASVPSATAKASEPTIAGIRCDSTEYDAYHVHAHLNIRVDGQLVLPPADIGVLATCHYWIHTHAAYGVIHVEAPAEGVYTLGQFFDIWGHPLSATRVGDHVVGPGESLFVFIDRKPASAADPRSIPLSNLSAIELQIGTAPLDPLPYTFPADLE